MSELTLNILGFQQVNKDLRVELLDPVTGGVVREVRPFLDGTVKVPRIDPGRYELRVKHPNLTLPVIRRPIRVLPTGPTRVSVLIDPTQFKDTPIADLPEANLQPVRQVAESVGEAMVGMGSKQPGEAIRADDWNALAGGVREIAEAVTEVTRLVSPVGHDHPEFVDKFDEVTTNFRTLLETLSAAMTELQRQIQAIRFRATVDEVIEKLPAEVTAAERENLRDLTRRLEEATTTTPIEFARTARNVGIQLQTKVSELRDRDGFPDPDDESVVKMDRTIEVLVNQRTSSYTAELAHHRKADRLLGGGLTQLRR